MSDWTLPLLGIIVLALALAGLVVLFEGDLDPDGDDDGEDAP